MLNSLRLLDIKSAWLWNFDIVQIQLMGSGMFRTCLHMFSSYEENEPTFDLEAAGRG